MRFLLAAIVVAVGLGYLLGGRLRNVEGLRLRWWWLAPVGLAMQLAPIPGHSDTAEGVSLGLLIASYPILLAFALRNVTLAGFPLIVAGLVLNFIVISANGGMPVGIHALIASGQRDVLAPDVRKDIEPKHHIERDDDVLLQLADVIPVGDPINQVLSAGDIAIYVGVVWLIAAAMRGQAVLSGYRPRHAARAHPWAFHSPPRPPDRPATRWGRSP
jgi:hypothetical protein